MSTTCNKLDDYSKDYSVIMFESDGGRAECEARDVLSLNSMINICSLKIIIRSVFHSDNNFYPQIYLNYCLYDKI